MNNRFAIAGLVSLLVISAQGQQNPTVELLSAREARSFIRIGLVPDSVDGDKYSLQYGIDSFADLDPLVAGTVLRTERGADIYLANYNPLQQSFTINSEATPDLSYAEVTKFLEDLKTAQANFAPPKKPAGALRAADDAVESDCQMMLRLMTTIVEGLDDEELTPERFKSAVDGAFGFEGVTRAADRFETAKNLLDTNVKNVRSALATLRNEFGSEGGIKAKRSCDPAVAITDAKDQKSALSIRDAYEKARPQADTILADKEKLSEALGAVLKDLAPYRVVARWRGPIVGDPKTLTDWDLMKVTPGFVNQQKVNVTAKVKSVTLEKNLVVVKELEKAKQTTDLRMRQDSLLIPERAAAVVYNRLKYPKYSTKTEGGKTIVVRTEDEDPWNAAVLLNLVMRLRRLSVANPMIQLGVSTAKDYPGLVAGIGLRFTEPAAFGISVGGMITRYKDLDDELQAGSEVAGQADIDKHLEHRVSPIVPYLAVQIKF